MAMSAYSKSTESSQMNYLKLHLKILEKQGHAKPKINRSIQIMKIRAKINELEKKIQRINKTKS
jgi:hypothetical protein